MIFTPTQKNDLRERLRRFYKERGRIVSDKQVEQDLEGLNLDISAALRSDRDPLEAQNEWFARQAANLAYNDKLYGS